MSSDSQNLELGNYRVLHRENGSLWELGKGSYGTTYKAEHIGLERISALKVINDHLIRDDVAKQRFQQEAKAAASLDHTHIASIHDFGEVDGMFYYAMKYCSGGDLESFCSSRGPQQWPLVKNFALQIFSALKAAHDKGMLHRDLKPSNVMLADENEPINLQLIDFGLVKALDHHNPNETALMATREGAFMGNPLTASPEQFREEDLDERSDLFSVGITLWYLLHGGSPFGNVAAAKIAHQRLSVESYDDMLPANIPGDARAILNKLLAPNREDRFRYAQDVIDALNASDDDSPPLVAESAPVVDETPFADSWEITSPIKQLPYGTFYGCYHKLNPGLPQNSVFIPDEHSPYLETIHHHAQQLVQSESLGLCNFFQAGEIDGTRLYLCQRLSNCTLQFLLQLVNRLSIHNDLSLLKQVAIAVDEANANHLSGVEMEDNEIFLALDPALGRTQLTAEEWPAYINGEAKAEGGNTAGLVAIVLPRLVEDTTHEASATIGGDDLASNPLARFAGFLYRVLSGMSAKQTAYLSTVNYVSFSDVSEESNQYLSHIIAGMETPDSAMSMLQQVCSNEGTHFDGASATIHASVANTNPLAAASPPPAQTPIPPKAAQTAPLSPSTPPQETAPSASATVVPPAQVAPPPAKPKPQTRKKKKKKGSPVLKAFFTLILLGGIGAGGFFGWQHLQKKKKPTDEFVHDGPVEDGIGEVNFTRVVFGDGVSSVPIGLQDKNGVTLGNYQAASESIKVTDFPINVFSESDRWPLRFVSLDPNYILNREELNQNSFSDSGSETKSNSDLIEIQARQTAHLTASFSFGGESVSNSQDFLKSLTGRRGANQWRISTDPEGTRLTLEEGQSFPVDARLAVPYMQPVDVTIERGTSIEASLVMETRPVKLIGIETAHELKFTPDYTKISDEAVRDLLRDQSDSLSTNGNELQQNNFTWKIPSLSGSIAITYSGQSNVVPVSTPTKFLVFNGANTHLPTETDAMINLRKRAESGDVTSQVNLAVMHYIGKKGDNSDGMADRFSFLWNFVAADQGDVGAQTEVGQAYMRGIGVDPNPAEAFSWLSKTAAANHPKGVGLLGRCYEDGKGTTADLNKALELYLKAAELGNLEAMGNLSFHYLNSGDSDKEKEAIKWLEIAAKRDHHPSLYFLGFCYAEGQGVGKDKKKAITLLEKAVELGNPDAELKLMELKKK